MEKETLMDFLDFYIGKIPVDIPWTFIQFLSRLIVSL